MFLGVLKMLENVPTLFIPLKFQLSRGHSKDSNQASAFVVRLQITCCAIVLKQSYLSEIFSLLILGFNVRMKL